MNIKNIFKKQPKQEQQYVDIKYSKLDHIGKVQRIPIVQKEQLDNINNQIANFGNQINNVKSEITTVKEKLNKKELIYYSYNEASIQFKKTEIKPGLYLYTLINVPKRPETISGAIPNETYFIEYELSSLHFSEVGGYWAPVHLKYKVTQKTSSNTGVIEHNTKYEVESGRKGVISFISEVNSTNTILRGYIAVMCFPYHIG